MSDSSLDFKLVLIKNNENCKSYELLRYKCYILYIFRNTRISKRIYTHHEFKSQFSLIIADSSTTQGKRETKLTSTHQTRQYPETRTNSNKPHIIQTRTVTIFNDRIKKRPEICKRPAELGPGKLAPFPRLNGGRIRA